MAYCLNCYATKVVQQTWLEHEKGEQQLHVKHTASCLPEKKWRQSHPFGQAARRWHRMLNIYKVQADAACWNARCAQPEVG
mmetsp:Transcript_28150/g.76900  ORF Transcript_28150/g.76900 Transcript_28150/m.76900 type:complete len:81 (-) Transcript_28150:735-977(-)